MKTPFLNIQTILLLYDSFKAFRIYNNAEIIFNLNYFQQSLNNY